MDGEGKMVIPVGVKESMDLIYGLMQKYHLYEFLLKGTCQRHKIRKSFCISKGGAACAGSVVMGIEKRCSFGVKAVI